MDFRRKWDKDEYEKLAEKRLTEEREKKDGWYHANYGIALLNPLISINKVGR